jgi:nucleotide-binding universal stress UspA family protein
MFPFVFKLWRYYGLPHIPDVPDIFAPAPVAAAVPAASARAAETDDIFQRAELQKKWRERYLPRLWGSRHPETETWPRVLLVVDDGSPAFAGALETASFLATHWNAALVESTVMDAVDQVFQTASREGADWVVASPPLAESLALGTRLTLLAVRDGRLAEGVRRILIPVDGTPSSLAAVAEGLRWAKTFGAELMVLHVAEDATPAPVEHPDFHDVLEHLAWEKVSHEIRNGEGTLADAIASASEDADLILMTTKRAQTAIEVMRRASVPVFVLHSEETD